MFKFITTIGGIVGLLVASFLGYPIVRSHIQPKVDRLLAQLSGGSFDYIPEGERSGCMARGGWPAKIFPYARRLERTLQKMTKKPPAIDWLNCRRTTFLERYHPANCGPEEIKTVAALCLAELGPRAKQAVPDLIRAATHGKVSFVAEGMNVRRVAAIWALEKIGDLTAVTKVHQHLCFDDSAIKKHEMECAMTAEALRNLERQTPPN